MAEPAGKRCSWPSSAHAWQSVGHGGAAQSSIAHSTQSQRTYMLLNHAAAPVRWPPVAGLCPTCFRHQPATTLRHAAPPQLMLALPWPLDRSSLRHRKHVLQGRRAGTKAGHTVKAIPGVPTHALVQCMLQWVIAGHAHGADRRTVQANVTACGSKANGNAQHWGGGRVRHSKAEQNMARRRRAGTKGWEGQQKQTLQSCSSQMAQ